MEFQTSLGMRWINPAQQPFLLGFMGKLDLAWVIQGARTFMKCIIRDLVLI